MVVPEGSVKAQGPCESVMVTGSCPCQGATQENAGLSIASPNSEVVSGHITQQAFGSAYNSCELTGTCKDWTGVLWLRWTGGKKENSEDRCGARVGRGLFSSPLHCGLLSLSLFFSWLSFCFLRPPLEPEQVDQIEAGSSFWSLHFLFWERGVLRPVSYCSPKGFV